MGTRGSKPGEDWVLAPYQQCAEAGMTKAEAAAHLNVSIPAVSYISKRYGVSFRDPPKRPKCPHCGSPMKGAAA